MKLPFPVTALVLCLVTGCAGTVMSPTKLAASEGSVRGAEEVGAAEEPDAGLYFKLAQDELERAKRLSADGEGEEADKMLLRAQADGDLAIALAKEAAAQSSAQAVQTEIQKEREGTAP